MAIIMEENRCISSIKRAPIEVITIEDISNDSYSEPIQVKQERANGLLSPVIFKAEHLDLEAKPLIIVIKEEAKDELSNCRIVSNDHSKPITNIQIKQETEEFIVKDETSNESIEFTTEKEASDEVNHQNSLTAGHECSLCDYKTRTQEKLRRHVLFHTGKKPHKCDHCDYTTVLQGDLRSHVLTHAEDVDCDIPAVSATLEDVTDGVARCTGDETSKSDNKPKANQNLRLARPFKCTKCRFAAASKRSLKSHKLTHAPKLFECGTCGHKTCTKDNLRRHVVVHFKCRIKRYSCPACKDRFLHKRSLERHMSVRPCKP